MQLLKSNSPTVIEPVLCTHNSTGRFDPTVSSHLLEKFADRLTKHSISIVQTINMAVLLQVATVFAVIAISAF